MRSLLLAVLVLSTYWIVAGSPPPLVDGLSQPVAVAVGADGRVYVATAGNPGSASSGAVMVVVDGKATPFVTGLDAPRGLASFQQWLFVTDGQRVWRLGLRGEKSEYAPASGFLGGPAQLRGIVADPESGTLYVTGTRETPGQGSALFRINRKGEVAIVTDTQRWPGLHTPTGVAMDGQSFVLVGDQGTGRVHRVNVTSGEVEQIAEGLGTISGLAWDMHGRLFISTGVGGKLFGIHRPGMPPVQLKGQFTSAAGLCLGPDRRTLLVANDQAGTMTDIATQVPGFEVDDTPMSVETAVAFPKLKWTGWEAETDSGKIVPHRPILLTHAGDGSRRKFVATQHGVIHVFPNDPEATATKVFLDIEKRVRYTDQENEEGFLGLAFHPDYKRTGEFFVFYTLRSERLVNVISRFRVKADDPDQADPDSEEVLLRIKRPFWNHDGGTLGFGPDGYLYIALGDGGAANDPFNNGQNLKTLLGTILRIDINKKGADKPYAIPPDNPFVGREDAAPEIWAYGLRNVWRFDFDAKTGELWAADVGQNLFEEINLITRGGNYGWKLREGLHPFSPKGVGPRPDLIEPIWEYHHDIGKSITGGPVYRGRALPELDGHYLYADYVSGRIWALRYDPEQRRVVANRPLRDQGQPIMSFGTDEDGEVYLMTHSVTGQGLFRLVRAPEGPRPRKD
ncbi:MAG TPA: PQQ-dependent sugar dehydrogenase [Gemmatales bacterium]|nr:PQQ-dependent sugar dehydrogenase [Gemmatales bacterium]